MVPVGPFGPYGWRMTAILEPRTEAPGTTEAVPPAVPPAAAPPVAVPAVPAVPAAVAPAGPSLAERLRETAAYRWLGSVQPLRLYGVAMIGLYVVGTVAQPAPDGPDPVYTWWEDVLVNAVFFGLLAILAGGMAARRWSLWAGLFTGGTLLASSLACPLTDHHEIAAWWFGQLAAGAAMTVLPAVLLRRFQAGSKAG
jgi:hypothetical protein